MALRLSVCIVSHFEIFGRISHSHSLAIFFRPYCLPTIHFIVVVVGFEKVEFYHGKENFHAHASNIEL